MYDVSIIYCFWKALLYVSVYVCDFSFLVFLIPTFGRRPISLIFLSSSFFFLFFSITIMYFLFILCKCDFCLCLRLWLFTRICVCLYAGALEAQWRKTNNNGHFESWTFLFGAYSTPIQHRTPPSQNVQSPMVGFSIYRYIHIRTSMHHVYRFARRQIFCRAFLINIVYSVQANSHPCNFNRMGLRLKVCCKNSPFLAHFTWSSFVRFSFFHSIRNLSFVKCKSTRALPMAAVATAEKRANRMGKQNRKRRRQGVLMCSCILNGLMAWIKMFHVII